MAYTPELSNHYSGILRRVAWALEKPMTKTLGAILDNVNILVDASRVCEKCKDRSWCKNCCFNVANRTGPKVPAPAEIEEH